MDGLPSFILKMFLPLTLFFLPIHGFDLNAFTIEPVKIKKRGEPTATSVNQSFDPQLGFADCVKYMGYRPIGLDRYAMRFFNSCAERVNINICVLKDDGSTKLYRSIRRVPVAGNMDIYTLPGDAPPRSIKMAYGYSLPAIPRPCTPDSPTG